MKDDTYNTPTRYVLFATQTEGETMQSIRIQVKNIRIAKYIYLF